MAGLKNLARIWGNGRNHLSYLKEQQGASRAWIKLGAGTAFAKALKEEPPDSTFRSSGIARNFKDGVIPQARKSHSGPRIPAAVVFDVTQAIPNTNYLGEPGLHNVCF